MTKITWVRTKITIDKLGVRCGLRNKGDRYPEFLRCFLAS